MQHRSFKGTGGGHAATVRAAPQERWPEATACADPDFRA